MAEIVRMPKLSDTMTEGVVASWLKQVGDEVESGEILAEIETDKATMEFESFFDGVLLHIGVEQGSTAPVAACCASWVRRVKIFRRFWKKPLKLPQLRHPLSPRLQRPLQHRPPLQRPLQPQPQRLHPLLLQQPRLQLRLSLQRTVA